MGKNGYNDEIDQLERRLETWATHDLSDDAKSSCNDLIDRLAGIEPSAELSDEDAVRTRRKPWLWSSAAAITLGLLIWFVSQRPNYDETLKTLASAHPIATPSTSDFTVLRSVNRVDAREDDGLIIPTDGAAPYYRYRYHVVDEEQIKDKETGAVITLRQPRQEVVTVPVTQF